MRAGRTESLTLDVYDDAGTPQTASAATVTVYFNGADQVSSAAATVGGTVTATYSLADTVSDGTEPVDDYRETWLVTIDGEEYRFVVTGYIVRTKWVPSITDADLFALHPELCDQLCVGKTYADYRTRAAERIQRELIAKGRRPWLVFDTWALLDAHVSLSLHYIFTAFAASTAAEHYQKLADRYGKQWHRRFGSVAFRYDNDETGVVNDGAEQSSAQGPILLTAGPVPQRWW